MGRVNIRNNVSYLISFFLVFLFLGLQEQMQTVQDDLLVVVTNHSSGVELLHDFTSGHAWVLDTLVESVANLSEVDESIEAKLTKLSDQAAANMSSLGA